MALTNAIFKGNIDGKTIYDYVNKIDADIQTLEDRKKKLEEILNIHNGQSEDRFWQEVWDTGVCKTYLGQNDVLWTDTNVAHVLEELGNYLLSLWEKDSNRYSKPTKEVEINEVLKIDEISNDKNYRLAPPEKISSSDYHIRNCFNGDYDFYMYNTYEKYSNRTKKKVIDMTVSRYGDCDEELLEYTISKRKSRECWENLKRIDQERVNLLLDARDNYNIMKQQLKDIQNGEKLCYHSNPIIQVYKYDFIERGIPLHKQLQRLGLSNEVAKEVNKVLYSKKDKSTELKLKHLTSNLASQKDYMIQCKLSHLNRVYINPDKCPVNKEILNHVSYTNPEHVAALLYLPKTDLTFENDMSIFPYDIDFMLNMLYDWNLIDEKDLHIVEGLRFRVTDVDMAKELGVSSKTIQRRRKKIVDAIVSLNKN